MTPTAVRMMGLFSGNLEALRCQPTPKQVGAFLAGEPVVDTCDAMLVWEPRRIVPTYAAPIAGEDTAAATFRPDDPDLADYVVLAFDQFNRPRDPVSRFDVLAGSRHVRIELERSEMLSYCAYAARAMWRGPTGNRCDAELVRDRICLFDERVDVTVDGVRRERPVTPWS